MASTIPLFVPGGMGPPELAIILIIAILLFGANKIPKLARSTGEALGEFQKGREKVEQELEEMREETIGDLESGDRSSSSSSRSGSTPTGAGSSADTESNSEDADAEPETDPETETE